MLDSQRGDHQRIGPAATGWLAPWNGGRLAPRREPHGLEGLALGAKEGPPRELSLAYRGRLPHRLCHLDAGQRAYQPKLHDALAAGPAHVEHLPARTAKSAAHRLPPGANAVVAAERRPLGF